MSHGRKQVDDESGNQEDKTGDLPQDIILHALPPYLDPKSLGILPRLSRYWHRLFSREDPWRISLITHLGVKKEVLDRLEKLRQEDKITFDYKQMYGRYYRLNQIKINTKVMLRYLNSVEESDKIRSFYELQFLNRWQIRSDENMQFFVLACCTNDPSLFAWIPRELRFSYHLLSILLGSEVFEQFFDLNLYDDDQIRLLLMLAKGFDNSSLIRKLIILDKQKKLGMIDSIHALNLAARSGNLTLVQELLALKDDKGYPRFIPTVETLNGAALSGNLTLVQELLALKDDNEQPMLIPTQDTLNNAAESGDVALVQILLAHKDDKGQPTLIPDYKTLSQAVYYAAKSGNLALVKTLFAINDERQNKKIIPTGHMLGMAVAPFNLELIQELLARNPTLDLHNYYKWINIAALPDNSAFVLPLLALKQNESPMLFPTNEILKQAAKSGNLALVQGLLAAKDNNGEPRLIAYIETLDHAAESGNLALVQALLALKDDKWQPRLIPTINTLNIAAISGSLALVQALLALKDDKGQPRLIPTISTIFVAAKSGNLALVRALLRNDTIVLDQPEQVRELISGLSNLSLLEPRYVVNYFQSYLAMLSAYRVIVDDNNVELAADHLKTAYEAFSLFFFEDLDEMLKRLTQAGRHEKLIPLIHQAVADLIQTQLARTDLPLCEIEILKLRQKKFSPSIEPPRPKQQRISK